MTNEGVGKRDVKTCSKVNKAVVFSGFNKEVLETVKANAEKSDSETYAAINRFEVSMSNAAEKMLQVSYAGEVDKLQSEINSRFPSFNWYIEELVVSKVKEKVKESNLNTKSGFEKLAGLVSKVNNGCFALSKKSCLLVEDAIERHKADFFYFNPKVALESLVIKKQ